MNGSFYDVVAIPVINALVGIAKLAGLKKRYCPILAVILGIAMGLGVRGPNEDLFMAGLKGVIIGLSAVGLYSGGRNVLRGEGMVVQSLGRLGDGPRRT
ncbi:MAG: hypothetical protein GXX09_10270 [Syntrophomonadaceae bacterium]|nr:hypothetical protein [Syntrophomonadaceae bacterium]